MAEKTTLLLPLGGVGVRGRAEENTHVFNICIHMGIYRVVYYWLYNAEIQNNLH